MDNFITSLPDDCVTAVSDLEKFVKNFAANTEVTQWENHVFPPNFMAETAMKAYYDWAPKEGDVFVVSYPKSGTHWVAEITKHLVYKNDPESKQFYECHHPWEAFMTILEFGPPSKFDIIDRLPLTRRVFLSHLPPNLMNLDKIRKAKAKIIYVYRNPKDQTVSWYHFIRKVPYTFAPQFKEIYRDDWAAFCKNYFSGLMPSQIPLGQWYPEHLLRWYHRKQDDNIHFLAYEDLKKNLSAEVKNIAKFLGEELNMNELSTLLKQCSFETMKSEAQGSDLQDKYKLYRKGEVGEWKSYFSPAQSRDLDKILKEKLQNTDVTFTYEL